jgi:hypothetical protein
VVGLALAAGDLYVGFVVWLACQYLFGFHFPAGLGLKGKLVMGFIITTALCLEAVRAVLTWVALRISPHGLVGLGFSLNSGHAAFFLFDRRGWRAFSVWFAGILWRALPRSISSHIALAVSASTCALTVSSDGTVAASF